MDYSMPPQMVKLTGFPEKRVEDRHPTPPRIINVISKPATNLNNHINNNNIRPRLRRSILTSSLPPHSQPLPPPHSQPPPPPVPNPRARAHFEPHSIPLSMNHTRHRARPATVSPQPHPSRPPQPHLLRTRDDILSPSTSARYHKRPSSLTSPLPPQPVVPSPQPSIQLVDEMQTLGSQLQNLTKLLESFMKIHHEQATTMTTHSLPTTTLEDTEEDSLADVSMASRDYLKRHNIF